MTQTEAERESSAVRALWLEWRVTHQLSGGNAETYMMMAGDPPAWFRHCELGLAVLEGPTVFWTMANLARINRKHRRLFARGERVAEPVLTPEQRQRKLRARLKLAEAA